MNAYFPRVALQRLLPDADRTRLPRLGSTRSRPPGERVAHARIYAGPATFYAVEFDGHDVLWCYATGTGTLGDGAWGNASLRELASMNEAAPLTINGITRHHPVHAQRDERWTPVPMAVAMPGRFAPAVTTQNAAERQGWKCRHCATPTQVSWATCGAFACQQAEHEATLSAVRRSRR